MCQWGRSANKFRGELIGGIILAGVKLITSVFSTTVLDNPDLAFGNILGSSVFNLFILAWVILLSALCLIK